MDYTLAEYYSEQFESLSAAQSLEKLVYKLGYPEPLLRIQYDHSYFIRGLVVDKEFGNIIKLDRHKYVKRAMHGFSTLSKEDRASMYDSLTTSGGGFGEPRFAVLDAMFALPDAYLFSSVVAYKDANPGEINQSYSQIYKDVRTSVDMCHRDGSIKDRVKENPEKYIQRDPQMVHMLRQLKRSGRKVFLLTNSLWNYTDVVMNYLYGLEKEGRWIDLFDVIITGSCKPAFLLNNKLSLYRVDPDSGGLSNTEGVYEQTAEEYLAEGKCFQGGNYSHLHDLVGVQSGTHLLYVGDHIFSDVLRSKRTLGWRTMLIVPELEHEINTMHDQDTMQLKANIDELRDERDAVDEWVDRLEGLLVSSDSLPVGKRKVVKAELEEARDKLEAMRAELIVQVEMYHKRFHSVWGQLFKTGLQNSRFAEQVEDYACLYTSAVTNIGLVSPEIYWRAMADLMPHDRLEASPMRRVLKKRAERERLAG
ncbi:cytosolic IMP-GMP specific 5'-nucleotidase [Chondrus crispus]|uniref:Cytosolic IMP-GMP specific 5'-nucleotidase n=1 Tax=Chondrus crispus TaxID=2769 RepID=R7QL05_CHOCR|nr:cytosolic IMP-GMP specific 5'-nucleotidase [Chondrus crispus]CDF38166.1 cytosolic IMP-GMP specific 5'-nucleotidase [Chondrus crispus]|eukprot:XP_005718035.1 cytosolic IMP-GMP specific 5'-nucleotidase [Chondrus crispus]